MKKIFFLFVVLCSSTLMLAQQNVGYRATTVVSPQVNADKTVTFRLNAPKARDVQVVGDWPVTDNAFQAIGSMVQNTETGIWEYTTPELESDMYTYRFRVDGILMLDPENAFTRRDVGNVFNYFFVGGGDADYYQVHDVPHGNVTTTWYHHVLRNTDRRLTIYTPFQYRTNPTKRFPVLYLLHGSGGDETAWNDLGMVAHIMDNLIAEGQVEPMIVVMPNGNPGKTAAPGETSENMNYKPVLSQQIPNSYKDGTYETNFNEIISFVDRNYRTRANKQNRAIAGLSMGGFHTLFVSLNNPDKFAYMGLFSAGLNFTMGVDFSNPAYSDMDVKLQNLKKAGYKLFWMGCGDGDFLWEANLDFEKRMHRLEMPNFVFYKNTRGHIWSNWRKYLMMFSKKLFN